MGEVRELLSKCKLIQLASHKFVVLDPKSEKRDEERKPYKIHS